MTDPTAQGHAAHCSTCGAPLGDGTTWCGVCGIPQAPGVNADAGPDEALPGEALLGKAPDAGALDEALDTPVAAPDTEPGPDTTGAATAEGARLARPGRLRAFWRHPWARRALAVLAAGALASPLVVDDLGTRSRLADTRTRLQANQLALTRTRADLSGARKDLAATRKDLAATRVERDTLQAKLDATTAELTGVRGSLSEAQSRLNLQAGQIATLKSCLGGVVQALVYIGDGYYGLAVSALQAVGVACQQASELF